MDVYRQRVVIDVVWTAPSGSDPQIDWESELAQGLNEAGEYRGTLWELDVGLLKKLEPEEIHG